MTPFYHAVSFAASAHAGQTRKGKPDIPYIVHPLLVALLLQNVGAPDDIVIAGILHDTVEDSKATIKNIKEMFGQNIANLVHHVTEADKTLPWEKRKEEALKHIKDMPQEALLLKSADILANLMELATDLQKHGEEVFRRFNASKEKKIAQQEKLLAALEQAWTENPFLPEIRRNVAQLL